MNKKLLALVSGVVFASGVALAQTISVPTVSSVNPNKDLVQIIPMGQPQAGNIYATPAQILSTSNYTKISPLGGGSQTFANPQTNMVFNGAGTAATYTITMPPGPSDGDQVCFWSSGAISTLTVSANAGQSINNAVTTLSANTGACYLYSASNTTWDRS